MRELHVVSVSDDGRHVVLAASPDAKRGTFRVPLDARLRSAVQGRLTPRPSAPVAREQPALTVREIQARLRAGESAEDIAASAGVALERVERFAGPVWSEHEKMIKAARATPLLHSRRGLSALPLGEVVDLHFAQIDSLRPESVAWTARREETGTWLVEVSYVARARTRSGSWRYDPGARTLVAADTVSASLGHSDTAEVAATPTVARRRSPAPARAAGAAGAATRTGAPRKTPAKVTAKPVLPAAKAPATRARPRRASGAVTPSRAPAAVRTTPGTKAPPVVQRPGQQAAARSPAAPRPARKTAAPRSPAAARPAPAPEAPTTGAPATPPTLRVVPAMDQQPRQPAGRRTPSGARASVPAWADVLLSTSPPAPHEEPSSD